MANLSALLEKSVGHECVVTVFQNPGEFTSSVKGTVRSIDDPWMEIETKKGIQLINTELITTILIK